MTLKEEQRAIQEAIDSFPSEFELRGREGQVFRISGGEVVSDKVSLYVQLLQGGSWTLFALDTPDRIRSVVVVEEKEEKSLLDKALAAMADIAGAPVSVESEEEGVEGLDSPEVRPRIWRVHAEKIAEDCAEVFGELLKGVVDPAFLTTGENGRTRRDLIVERLILAIGETLEVVEDGGEV